MTKTTQPRLENKAASSPVAGELNAMFGEFMSAFEDFKAANDARIGEIEKRGSADTLLEGKLDKLTPTLNPSP